jgi:hypothetical protein
VNALTVNFLCMLKHLSKASTLGWCFCLLGLTMFGQGHADPVSQLITDLRNASDEDRESAATTLGNIKDPRAVEPLIAALKDSDAKVRSNAAFALGNFKDPHAVEPLIAAIKDTDSWVRRGAAWALGEIKDPLAFGPLTVALKDMDHEVRATARAALRDIQPPVDNSAIEVTCTKANQHGPDSAVQEPSNPSRSAAKALNGPSDTRPVKDPVPQSPDTAHQFSGCICGIDETKCSVYVIPWRKARKAWDPDNATVLIYQDDTIIEGQIYRNNEIVEGESQATVSELNGGQVVKSLHLKGISSSGLEFTPFEIRRFSECVGHQTTLTWMTQNGAPIAKRIKLDFFLPGESFAAMGGTDSAILLDSSDCPCP